MEMKITGFTPGKWQIVEAPPFVTGTGSLLAVQSNPPHGFTPCVIMGEGSKNKGVELANARLIASAPDLLAEVERLRAVNAELVMALKGVIERAHDSPPPGDVPVPYYVFQHARAALARASKETP